MLLNYVLEYSYIKLLFLVAYLMKRGQQQGRHKGGVCSVEESYDEESCQESLLEFDRKVSDIKHAFCSSCMCVSQNLKLVGALEVCKQYKSKKTFMKDQMTTHPVWFKGPG